MDQFFTSRAPERLLASWRLLGRDWAAATVTDGWQRLEALRRPLDEPLQHRNLPGDLPHGDETRWPLVVLREGKGWPAPVSCSDGPGDMGRSRTVLTTSVTSRGARTPAGSGGYRRSSGR